MSAPAITNALTIDVEDYFQVSAFAPHIARSEWNTRECRVERNVGRILEMLAVHQTKATFFTLGWIAERYPQLIRQIAGQGHEVASHGYGHERASDQTEADPAPGAFWNPMAFDSLVRAGYRYSSSVYPIKHDHYGMPDSPRFAYQVRPGLIEVPITTMRLFGRNLPSSGGGYFRLLPYALSRWMLNRVNTGDKQSGIFYFHPWEIDVAQPRIEGIGSKTRFRHYVNISRMEGRLTQLLLDFKWDRMDKVFLNKAPDGGVLV